MKRLMLVGFFSQVSGFPFKDANNMYLNLGTSSAQTGITARPIFFMSKLAFGQNESKSRRLVERRRLLNQSLITASGILGLPLPSQSQDTANVNQPQQTSAFDAYEVKPDASKSLHPQLRHVINKNLLNTFGLTDSGNYSRKKMKGGTLWLGEHHNSAADHTLQADLVRSIYDLRSSQKVAIGLEQVQVQFQPVLDKFVSGSISEEEMLEQVDWEKRWFWSFEKYRPIFDLAREKNIPLIALNVDSEDFTFVEKDGLQGLSKAQMRKYLKDPYGFVNFAQSEAFKTYASYVIYPSYKMHEDMGLLSHTFSGEKLEKKKTFDGFLAGRMLWDEAMATTAYSWCKNNPGALLIGMVGADHVKFGKGIPGRFERMAESEFETSSVLLNPTLIDTRPPGSVSGIADAYSSEHPDKITLQVRYIKEGLDYNSPDVSSPEFTGGVLPLADYILITKKLSLPPQQEYGRRTNTA